MTSARGSALAVGVGSGVAQADIEQLARQLQWASQQCHDIMGRLPALRTGASAGIAADLWDVQGALRRATDQFDTLAPALRTTAGLYDTMERGAAHALESLASQVTAAAAFLLSRLGIVMLPTLLAAASGAAAINGFMSNEQRAALGDALVEPTARLLAEPGVLEALRVAFSLADDGILGAVGVPPVLVGLVGDAGLGLSGIDSAALAVVGLAALAGARGVDPVRVDRVGADLRRGGERHPVSAPQSLADRAARIPEPSAPIVIEQYTLPDGHAHVEVYIAGTDAHAPMGGEQPWDMPSNVALVGGAESSSLQAVRAALAAEGVTSDTSIVFTGYSQGGAIATTLAESGDYRTTGLVTVGAPSGALPVRGDYPAIVIEHRDDLVPVLSGIRRDTHAIVVRGDGLLPGEGVAGALDAHDLDRYRSTAAEADAHVNAVLRAAIDALPQPQAAGVRSAYTATRIPHSAVD